MRKVLILILFSIFLFSGCLMNILGLSVPEGLYVGYDGNNWMQTDDKTLIENSKFVYDANLKLYKVTIDKEKINFGEIQNNDSIFKMGYYKVYYVKNDGNIASNSIPILETAATEDKITIYLDLERLSEGKSTGIGDDTKLNMEWYFAGTPNNWTPEKMTKKDDYFEITINKTYNANDSIEYKIPPSTTWMPWQMIFNGEVYSDSSQNQRYTFKSNVNGFTVKFYPLIGKVDIVELKVGDSQ